MAGIWVLTDRRYLAQRMPRAVMDWLEEHRHPARVVVADESGLVGRPSLEETAARSAWSELRAGDVVIARSRHPFALALLDEAEARGARTLGRSAAVNQVRDKVWSVLALAREGLPIPPTFLGLHPIDLIRISPQGFPLLLKPQYGDNAQGLELVEDEWELRHVDWPHQLVLAQTFMNARGIDHKIYIAGQRIWQVRRPSPLSGRSQAPVREQLTKQLRDFASRCHKIFDLPLLGIDVIETSAGPVIVDVNEFPNYTGIDDAPAVIGRLLLKEVARRPSARDSRLRSLPA